jgi:hypothetical protein
MYRKGNTPAPYPQDPKIRCKKRVRNRSLAAPKGFAGLPDTNFDRPLLTIFSKVKLYVKLQAFEVSRTNSKRGDPNDNDDRNDVFERTQITNRRHKCYTSPNQCESPNEVISPPEKNVPMMFPRVIGRSRCDGCVSSW